MNKFIILITLLVSGCGVMQTQKVSAQLEQQSIQSIKNKPGMKAVEYLIADDRMTKNEGGESLCVDGCTFSYIVDSANKKPFTIVALYVAIHDYSGSSPSDYKMDDVITRRKTGADILNNFSMAFGSSWLGDKDHVGILYKDFERERGYIGLDNVSESIFTQQVSSIYDKRQNIVNKISEMRASALAYVDQIEAERRSEYEKENPVERVHVDNRIPTDHRYVLISKAIGDMKFYKNKNQQEAILQGLPISESGMLNYVNSALETCKRLSAYSGKDIESYCISNVGREMIAFAKMINDPNTPQKTKVTAYSEALFGSYLDFGHAARLARMHNELCKQQGNDGYVDMVTVSVPCKNYKGAGIN